MSKSNIIIAAVLGVAIVYGGWQWVFCRLYVKPGYMAIVTAKEGAELEGTILAKKGQKGVQEEPLGVGRHFLNPYKYTYEIKPLLFIPPGKVGIVTSKVGTNLPSGEFLANPGQKGIWREPLGPGLHSLNPYGYDIDIIDAVSIPIGYVGVLTSLSGKPADPMAFAKNGEKGVMENILQPGLYYINPKAYKVDVIEIGLNQVSLLGKQGGSVLTKNAIATGNQAMEALQSKVLATQQAQRSEYLDKSKDMTQNQIKPVQDGKADKAHGKNAQAVPEFILNQHVNFPSRDGFDISLDMTVEFELLPNRVAAVYRNYGDMPAVVDKILMPQILSVSRLKGSAYKATDFIVGIDREKFQIDLKDELQKVLEAKNIEIHDALIRHVNVPQPILDPLQQASVAQEQDLTNMEKQKTEKKQAELNTETQLIEQKSAEVKQQTEKMQAEIQAEKDKAVAEIEADMTKKVAALERATAEVIAKKDTTIGQAKANSITLVEGEKAKGLETKVKAMGGARAYTMSEFANQMNPDIRVKVLHAGEGTLWTNGEISKGEAAIIKSNQKSAK